MPLQCTLPAIHGIRRLEAFTTRYDTTLDGAFVTIRVHGDGGRTDYQDLLLFFANHDRAIASQLAQAINEVFHRAMEKIDPDTPF